MTDKRPTNKATYIGSVHDYERERVMLDEIGRALALAYGVGVCVHPAVRGDNPDANPTSMDLEFLGQRWTLHMFLNGPIE